MGIKKKIRRNLNTLLDGFGLQLVRHWEANNVRAFLPLRPTLNAAREAGLPLSEYIDQRHQVPGATESTIENMSALRVFEPKVDNIVEIGPGTGRYLEKVLKICAPCRYEIYEPAQEWSNWLSRNYPVSARGSDGKTLGQTADQSVDLAHAHKVFTYLPTTVSYSYFKEIARVLRPGGRVVLDIFSEACMTDGEMEEWLSSGYNPGMLSKDFVIRCFEKNRIHLRGCFFAYMKPGRSEYLVFAKEASA